MKYWRLAYFEMGAIERAAGISAPSLLQSPRISGLVCTSTHDRNPAGSLTRRVRGIRIYSASEKGKGTAKGWLRRYRVAVKVHPSKAARVSNLMYELIGNGIDALVRRI